MVEFVLVHGAWHGGWCWRHVADGLRAAGHRVFTPTMTGLGERAHLMTAGTGVATHLADILAVLDCEELTDVVLVGHSYGARPTALATTHPAVRHWVSLDGVPVAEGATLFDGAPPELIEMVQSQLIDGLAMAPYPPELIGVPPGHAGYAWVGRRQTPMPWRCLHEPMPAHPARFAEVPKTYVRALGNTLAGPSNGGAEAVAASWPLVDIDSGHDLMVTAVDETVAALLAIAGHQHR
jgi:pimeloyl-ACP methyl ester carboxylesterase